MGREVRLQGVDSTLHQASERLKQKPKLAVIGIGNSGLSAAIKAQRMGFDVTIYTSLPVDKTTSNLAGASFKLHKVDDNGHLDENLAATWREYEIHAQNPESGVRKYTHFIADDEPIAAKTIKELHLLKEQDPKMHARRGETPEDYQYSVEIETFHIDTRKYLRYLEELFIAQGGHIELKTFTNTSQLETLPEQLIINCSGLGSRELFGDTQLEAVSGQIVVTDPVEGAENWTISGKGYRYNGTDKDGKPIAKYGGTQRLGDYSTQPNQADTEDILQRNSRRTVPGKIHEVYIGLRPYRHGGVRVEREHIGTKLIVHNYGHGGAGFTLGWGTAEQALKLITPEDLQEADVLAPQID